MNACRGFFPTYGVKPSAREPFSGGGGNGFPPLLASHGTGVIHCIATAMCEATGKWKPGKTSTSASVRCHGNVGCSAMKLCIVCHLH